MEKRFTIRIEGPRVRSGKIAVDDLHAILDPLQAAVRAMLPSGGDAERVNLLVSGIGAGSATAEVELDSAETPALPGFERDPIAELIDAASDPAVALPLRARNALDRVSKNLPGGVESVELRCSALEKSATITRADPLPQTPLREAYRAVEGRLVEIDFEAGVARLQVQPAAEDGQSAVSFEFDDSFGDELQRFARQIVRVHGIAQLDDQGRVATLKAIQLEQARDDRRAMWAPKRFKWPSDDEVIHDPDIEEFLRETREARQGAG